MKHPRRIIMKKRLISLLLVLLFVLSACNDESVDTSSADESAVSQEESSAYVPQNKTLISVGKPYQSLSKSHENYADFDGKQLTDGHKAPDTNTHYIDPRMVGYNSNGIFIIDLGEDGKNIISFSVRSLEMYEAGVGLASKVRFSGSDDNKKWISLGEQNFTPTGSKKNIVVATLDLDSPVDYRYIKVHITRSPGATFFFTDEIEIYADVPARDEDKQLLAYQNAELKRDDWKNLSTNNEAIYKNAVNIAEHKSYQYVNCETDSRAPVQSEYLQDDLRTFFTNGVPAGMTCKDNVWVGFSGKDGKIPAVTMDLEGVYDNVFVL